MGEKSPPPRPLKDFEYVLNTHGYGFQWWSRDYTSHLGQVLSFYASGNGGQRIMVFPSLDMVVAFTEGAYNQPTSSDAMISGYILPAVQE